MLSLEWVNEVGRDMLYTAFLVSMPALLVSFIVGLIVSIFQTITSIQDQTLSFVPRVLLTGLTVVLTLTFTLSLASAFVVRMFLRASEVMR
jgi:flagellar biosynthetic protein FliQ